MAVPGVVVEHSGMLSLGCQTSFVSWMHVQSVVPLISQ
jgi:hypothetical protein